MILHLDFSAEDPIYRQIRDQVVAGIASGQLKPGEKLPTVRALAEEAGINMMTVSRAYQLLKSEGYITTGRRDGAMVRLPRADPRRRLWRVCGCGCMSCGWRDWTGKNNRAVRKTAGRRGGSTMTIGWALFMWAAIIWLVPMMYFLMKNECKPKRTSSWV